MLLTEKQKSNISTIISVSQPFLRYNRVSQPPVLKALFSFQAQNKKKSLQKHKVFFIEKSTNKVLSDRDLETKRQIKTVRLYSVFQVFRQA